jgi:hypothetical protein
MTSGLAQRRRSRCGLSQGLPLCGRCDPARPLRPRIRRHQRSRCRECAERRRRRAHVAVPPRCRSASRTRQRPCRCSRTWSATCTGPARRCDLHRRPRTRNRPRRHAARPDEFDLRTGCRAGEPPAESDPQRHARQGQARRVDSERPEHLADGLGGRNGAHFTRRVRRPVVPARRHKARTLDGSVRRSGRRCKQRSALQTQQLVATGARLAQLLNALWP